MVLRVFISYGHDAHDELAAKLNHDLQESGHETWYDRERLIPGEDWETCIERGIEWCAEVGESGRVILLMTPHAVRRPDGYCLNEIARALSRRLRPIPVMVVLCEPPLSICRIQWLDMQDCVPVASCGDRYEVKWGQLLEALLYGRLDTEGGQAKLLGSLDPPDFIAEIREYLTGFVGREWVFDRLRGWLDNDKASRVFWIVGGPGAGKTAISINFCQKHGAPCAYHLCRHGIDGIDPRQAIRSLAYQLACQFPEVMAQLMTMDLDAERVQPFRSVFDSLVTRPLARASPNSPLPKLIVIDALDEATEVDQATGDRRNDLADCLAHAWRFTPPWLRLVVTSRPDPEVVPHLSSLAPVMLDLDDRTSQDNTRDLRCYLQGELTALGGGAAPAPEVVENLLDKSEGKFLYVEGVIKGLRSRVLTIGQLDQLPPGLSGFFLDAFGRQFSDLATYRDQHLPLLQMIVAARGPLPLELARQALGWDANDYQVNRRGSASGRALAPLGSLFSYEHGHIRPFHMALAEWLTDGRASQSYYADRGEGHNRLAEACWGEFCASPSGMSDYAETHLPAHLMHMERWDDLLSFVIAPRPGLIEKWVEGGDEQGIRCLRTLIAKCQLEPVHRAALSSQLARIHSNRGEYEEAEKLLVSAVERTSRRHGRRTHAIALHELGSLHLYRRELPQAATAYRRALRICVSGRPVYHDEAVSNRIALATVACQQYRWPLALRLARQALREAQAVGDFRHAIAAERLRADALMSLGRHEEAAHTAEAALEWSEREGSEIETARLLVLLGGLCYGEATIHDQPYTEAIALYERAAQVADGINHFHTRIDATLRLGWCALAEGRADDAAKYFEQVPPTFPSGTHDELIVESRLGMAGCLEQKGEIRKAEEEYAAIVEMAKRCDSRGYLTRALIGLGAVRYQLGQPGEGEALWQQARHWAKRDSIRRQQLTEAHLRRRRRERTADSGRTPPAGQR